MFGTLNVDVLHFVHKRLHLVVVGNGGLPGTTDSTETIERLELVLSELIVQLSSLGERGCVRRELGFSFSTLFHLKIQT